MRNKNAPFYNLTGGMNLQDSDFNLDNTSKSLFWRESENVEINKRGGISKMYGNQSVVEFPNGTEILGLHEYVQGDDRVAVGVWSDGVQGYFCEFDFINGTYQIVQDGLHPTSKCFFTNFINGVIVTNNEDEPFIYVKDDDPEIRSLGIKRTHNIAGGPSVVFKGRVLVSSGGAVYGSGASNPTKWVDTDDDSISDSFVIPEFHNSTGYITAFCLYGDKLAIYREKEVFIMAGSVPEGDDPFIIYPFGDKGSASHKGVINFDNNQYFFDDGFFNLQYNTLHNVELSTERSILIHPAFNEVDHDRLSDIVAVGYPKKNQVWFFMPINGETDLSTVWVMDLKSYKKPCWYTRRTTPVQCAMLFNREIYTGVRASAEKPARILRENIGTTLEGVPFRGKWFSQFLSMNETTQKVIQHMHIAWDTSRTNVNTQIVYRYNGNMDIEVKATGGLSTANYFRCDDSLMDNDLFVMGNIGQNIQKVKVPMAFTTISVGLRNNDDFGIDGFTMIDVSLRR